MTLNGRYALYGRKDASFGVHYENLKTYTIGAKMCDIRFTRKFGVPWGEGVKRQWGCRQRQISAFSRAISSETLEMRPALLYRPIAINTLQSVVGFSVIPQNAWPWMTIFPLNSTFAPVFLTSGRATFQNNNCLKSWKLIKIDTYCPQCKYLGLYSFW